MDGVRRSRVVGGTLNLATTMPKPAAMPVSQSIIDLSASAIDGLRHMNQVAFPALEPAIETNAEYEPVTSTVLTAPRHRYLPYAIAGMATLPILAVGTVMGARSLSQTGAKVQASVPAQPAEQTEATQAAPNPQPTPAPMVAEAAGLQQLLDGFGKSTTYSLYVKDLKTGAMAVVGPDRSFRSASFYKLFVASEIYKRIDAGKLSLSSPVGGTTVKQCLNLMITISDNPCGNALGQLLGWRKLTTDLKAQGYKATSLNQPMMTSARDVASLYDKLYTGQLLSEGSTAQFLGLLKAQKINNRLRQGLPSGTTFAHKTGDLYGFMHDGGIVYGPKTDYLVVMMGAPGAYPSDFSRLSSQLHKHFNQ